MISFRNVTFSGILSVLMLTLSGCGNRYTLPPMLKIANIREGQVISGHFRVYVQTDSPNRSEFYCTIDENQEQEWFQPGSTLNRRVGGRDQFGVEMDSTQFPDGKYTLTLAEFNRVMDKRTVYFKNKKSVQKQ